MKIKICRAGREGGVSGLSIGFSSCSHISYLGYGEDLEFEKKAIISRLTKFSLFLDEKTNLK